MINLSALLTRQIEAMNANDFTDESFALSAAVQMQEKNLKKKKVRYVECSSASS